MQSRMKSPALTLPGAMDALLALSKSVGHGELPRQVLELTNLRASQINGCSVCVEMHARSLKKMGEADERIFATAAWRESPYYTEAERAALALAEAVTRLADRPHPVPDDVWNEAARHYSQAALAALVLSLGVVNMWNRLNAATQQMSGPWTAQHV